MAQATFSYRMDRDIKDRFEHVCEGIGMNATTAINIFAKRVIKDNAIPFSLVNTDDEKKFTFIPSVTREGAVNALRNLREQALKNKPEGMTLDEINKEIAEVRREIKERKSKKIYV